MKLAFQFHGSSRENSDPKLRGKRLLKARGLVSLKPSDFEKMNPSHGRLTLPETNSKSS